MQTVRYYLWKDKYFKLYAAIMSYTFENKKFEVFVNKTIEPSNLTPYLLIPLFNGHAKLTEKETELFIKSRIIPSNRINISEILKSANLKEYDEFGMLLYTNGKCVQDELYLEEISYDKFNSYKLLWGYKDNKLTSYFI